MYLGSLGMSLTPPGCPEGYIQTVHSDEEDILFFFLNKALDFFFSELGKYDFFALFSE